MTTIFKILLAVSVALFLASLTEAGSAIAWGVLKPISAVLFIVFYIGQVLHKEVVKYEEECRLTGAQAHSPLSSAPRPASSTPQRTQKNSALAAAH